MQNPDHKTCGTCKREIHEGCPFKYGDPMQCGDTCHGECSVAKPDHKTVRENFPMQFHTRICQLNDYADGPLNCNCGLDDAILALIDSLRPAATASDEEVAEEICKEAYFDMTVHPSENPPLGAFMGEYVGNVEKRIAAALAEQRRGMGEALLGAVVPERAIVNFTQQPKERKIYLEAVTEGYNEAVAALREHFAGRK